MNKYYNDVINPILKKLKELIDNLIKSNVTPKI